MREASSRSERCQRRERYAFRNNKLAFQAVFPGSQNDFVRGENCFLCPGCAKHLQDPKGAKGGSGTLLGITNLRFRLYSRAHKMISFAGRIVSCVLDARSSFKIRKVPKAGAVRF